MTSRVFDPHHNCDRNGCEKIHAASWDSTKALRERLWALGVDLTTADSTTLILHR